eukprot:SAG22_NODE_3225_length_1846_cov_1.301088_2_plen_153_part_00
MAKTCAALGVSAETLWGPDRRNIDWSASNRVADAIFAQKTLEEWEPILAQHDVWWAKVHRFEDQRDPDSPAHVQAKAAGAFTAGDHVPGVSRHDLLPSPVQLSRMDATPRVAAPVFGAHTHELLAEPGVSASEVAALLEAGVAAVSAGKAVR